MAEQSNDRKELLKKRISGWLRQSRYRARKSNVSVDVSYQDVIDLYEDEDYKCAYCDELADSPDHPFPIKDRGPCVLANIVPCCDNCRDKKKNRDLVEFYKSGHIDSDRFRSIIRSMLQRDGKEPVRDYLKDNYAETED